MHCLVEIPSRVEIISAGANSSSPYSIGVVCIDKSIVCNGTYSILDECPDRNQDTGMVLILSMSYAWHTANQYATGK